MRKQARTAPRTNQARRPHPTDALRVAALVVAGYVIGLVLAATLSAGWGGSTTATLTDTSKTAAPMVCSCQTDG